MDNPSNLPNSPLISPPLRPPHKFMAHWLVAGVAIAVVVGYFVVSYYYALWPFENLAAPISIPEPAIKDPTAGWKTYRNEEYGFEVKYPPGWVRDSGSQALFEGETTFYNSIGFYDPKQGMGFDTVYRFSIYYVPGKSLDAVLKSPIFPKSADAQTNGITLAGAEGLEILYKLPIDIKYILLPKNGDTFIIRVDKQDLSSEEKNKIDQILSTFRFTDSTDTSTWQTYRNEEYGFELQYPYVFEFEDKGEITPSPQLYYNHWLMVRASGKEFPEYLTILVYNDINQNLNEFVNTHIFPGDSVPKNSVIGSKEVMESLHVGLDGETNYYFWLDPTKKRGAIFWINPAKAENLSEFHKIVGSFKFTW